MAGFRRYLFFVLALSTALAVGIALGGGPLQGRFASQERAVSARTAELNRTVVSLRRNQLFNDAMNAATSRQVVRNQLVGRTVALLVLPGVGASTATGVTNAVEDAGATVTVSAHISPDLINPAKKTYVDSVADSSLKGRDAVAQAAGVETYERISALVARAYVGHGDHTDFDAVAAGIDAELQGARLVSLEKKPVRRGALVVVVAPGASPRSELTTASNVIQSQFVAVLAAASDGMLVAAPPSSSSPGGLLNAVKSLTRTTDLPISTLNVINSPSGRVAAVYALAASADGLAGEYGVSTSGARLPPGLTSVAD